MKKFKELSPQDQDELKLWAERGCVQYKFYEPDTKWYDDDERGCELLPNMYYRIKPGAVKPRCMQYTRRKVPTLAYRVTTTPSHCTMRDGFGYTPEQAYNAWVKNHTCDTTAL